MAEVSAKTEEELKSNDNIIDDAADDYNEEELKKIKRNLYRNYKIQEVIARRQILLVQVVKEERGTKGAALTTYISIAGRYCVLMPNTPRGGGVSRKIANISDRKRLKKIVDDLDVSTGMAVIIRTAGSKRTKVEIKRDYSNSISIWENVKKLTLESNAPYLIHEEGSLIKRAIRDLYNSEIDEVLVEGSDAYKVCKNYMKAVMTSHTKKVQQYSDDRNPLFQKFKLDTQLQDIFNPRVTLKSGGYLIIDQTEALVAIDVNSGKATRERSIEDTAVKTNLEAAEEFARQSRLRDLSGLIVIDFIDMEEVKNRNLIEKKLKEAMRKDRARVQIGEISNFGLLELSRQRLRPSVVENSSELCPQCGGSGRIQSVEVSAIQILRSIEEEGNSGDNLAIKVSAHSDLILHILNKKRSQLDEIEGRYNLSIDFINDNSIIPPQKKLEIIKNNHSSNQEPIEIKSNNVDIEDEENQNRKKRSKRVNKRKKKALNTTSNESNTTIIEEVSIKSENTDINNHEEIPKKKARKKISNPKLKTSKSKANNKPKASLKKIKETEIKILDTDDNKTEIREIKSSSPIEVTQVDEKSSSEKPKKKGWWSK